MSVPNILLSAGLSFLFFISCNNNPSSTAGQELKEPVIYRVPYDTLTDDLVGFISGTSHGRSGCLAELDSASRWKGFSFSMDSGFYELDTSRFMKMKKWADAELINRFDSTTLFYPFGGPDILNANIFYPNAREYILFGLEPVGMLPEICKMTTDQVNSYLDDVWYSLKDIFKRSYFITGNMIDALKKNSVNGAIPVISLFLKRSGYNIVSLNYIGVDSTGRWFPADKLAGRNAITKGVRIEFAADTGKRIQSVYYFQTDISDEGLKKNAGFRKYLEGLTSCHTYLKAASYLMHGNEFSMIRNLVFEKSKTILQDDSGIAYKLFDKNIWEIHLYGKYQRPGKEFSWINETDLARAYQDTSIKPVPFTLGYNWRTRAINLLYAVKR
jgi:hypothetical protein